MAKLLTERGWIHVQDGTPGSISDVQYRAMQAQQNRQHWDIQSRSLTGTTRITTGFDPRSPYGSQYGGPQQYSYVNGRLVRHYPLPGEQTYTGHTSTFYRPPPVIVIPGHRGRFGHHHPRGNFGMGLGLGLGSGLIGLVRDLFRGRNHTTTGIVPPLGAGLDEQVPPLGAGLDQQIPPLGSGLDVGHTFRDTRGEITSPDGMTASQRLWAQTLEQNVAALSAQVPGRTGQGEFGPVSYSHVGNELAVSMTIDPAAVAASQQRYIQAIQQTAQQLGGRIQPAELSQLSQSYATAIQQSFAGLARGGQAQVTYSLLTDAQGQMTLQGSDRPSRFMIGGQAINFTGSGTPYLDDGSSPTNTSIPNLQQVAGMTPAIEVLRGALAQAAHNYATQPRAPDQTHGPLNITAYGI